LRKNIRTFTPSSVAAKNIGDARSAIRAEKRRMRLMKLAGSRMRGAFTDRTVRQFGSDWATEEKGVASRWSSARRRA